MKYILLIVFSYLTPHLAAATNGNSENCDSIIIQPYYHLGNHVTPASNLEFEIFWYDENTGFGLREIARTNTNGILQFNRNKLISRFEQNGGKFPGTHFLITVPAPFNKTDYFQPYLRKIGHNSLPYTDISPLNIEIKRSMLQDVLSDKTCETIKPTVKSQFFSDESTLMFRKLLTSVWAVNTAQDYLSRVTPNQLGNTSQRTEIYFSREGQNQSYARRGSSSNDHHFIQLDLANESRVAFTTIHELGHVLMYDFLSIDNLGGPHSGEQCYTTNLALSEGFASYFSYSVLSDYGTNLSLSNLSWADKNVFSNLESNFSDQLDKSISPSWNSPNCYSYENEVLITESMSKMLNDGIVPFSDMWSSLQDNQGYKFSSFEDSLKKLLNTYSGEKRKQLEHFLSINFLYIGADAIEKMLMAKQRERDFSSFVGRLSRAGNLCLQTSLDNSYFGNLRHGNDLLIQLTGKSLNEQDFFKNTFNQEYDPHLGISSLPKDHDFYLDSYIDFLNSLRDVSNEDYLCVRFEQIYSGLNSWREKFCNSESKHRFTYPLDYFEGFSDKMARIIDKNPLLIQNLQTSKSSDVITVVGNLSKDISMEFGSIQNICK
ncbi:MAG: hypothetical protein KDD34_07795 [Bdellovibrionales bacterium]|nr:hypothetical protein [Bdellovibrionales bacterium]